MQPTTIPSARMIMIAAAGGIPLLSSLGKRILAAPITNGMERSNPPNSETIVCPIDAKPKNAASNRIDLAFCKERNPLTVNAPHTTSIINSAIPMAMARFSRRLSCSRLAGASFNCEKSRNTVI
ncbi:hypothetical protein D3C72_1520230 [compost metagenome]